MTEEEREMELTEARQRIAELEGLVEKGNATELALMKERDGLTALLDGLNAAGIGIDIVDVDYTVIHQNKVLRDRFGDICGKLCYEEYMGVEEPCDFCPMKRAIASGKTESTELVARDGRHYELLSAPIATADGAPDRVIEMVRDITERKQTEEALRVMQQCIDTSVVPVFWVEPGGRFSYVNEAACRDIGYSREELLALSVADIAEQFGAEEWPAKWQGFKAAGSMSFETEHRRKDGTTYPVQIMASHLEHEGQELLFAFAVDITDRKDAERELAEQQVVKINSDRLRSLGEMATGIAHELSQPLVGVRGLAEHLLIAKERGWEMSEERVNEMLEGIVEQADRMTHIIEHIRMFAREAGKPDVQRVSLNDVIISATGMVQAQLRSRGIKLQMKLAPDLQAVIANPYSLEEVVLNLLINARDAVEERVANDYNASSAIVVRTFAERDESSLWIMMSVTDHGAGISTNVTPRVFEPFFSTKDPDQGTGLGLPISRSIVERFGGHLELESVPGKGTTATVALPAEQED